MSKKMAIADWFSLSCPRRLERSQHAIVLQEKYGYDISGILKHNKTYEEYASLFKDADLVLVTNGFRREMKDAGDAARDLNKNIIYSESGVMPQAKHVSIDHTGLFCTHSLCNDLSWITGSHIDEYKNYILRSKYSKYINSGSGDYILCCLQVEWDAQITHCTDMRNIDLVKWCLTEHPNEHIIIRSHPAMTGWKSNQAFEYIKNEFSSSKTSFLFSSASKEIPFLEQASSATEVVGLNSTALIEALAIGIKVTALASCPIHCQLTSDLSKEEYDYKKIKLLSGYYASQYAMGDRLMAEKALNRFSFL